MKGYSFLRFHFYRIKTFWTHTWIQLAKVVGWMIVEAIIILALMIGIFVGIDHRNNKELPDLSNPKKYSDFSKRQVSAVKLYNKDKLIAWVNVYACDQETNTIDFYEEIQGIDKMVIER